MDAQKVCKKLDFKDLSPIKNAEYVNKGDDGTVMKCQIDNISFLLSIKIYFNEAASTKTHMRFCTEQKILKQIPYHPNINYLIHYFNAKPTQEMISFIHQKEAK